MFSGLFQPGRLSSLAILSFLLVFSWPASGSSEEAGETTLLTIDHQPATVVTAGNWTEVEAQLESAAAILEVRLYFKTMKSDWYVYVPMTGRKDNYSARIPPARNATQGLDYFLLIVLADNQVLRTKNYRVLVQDSYAAKKAIPPLMVETEHLDPPPTRDDFGIPLQVTPAARPLLASVVRYQHPPIEVPGPASGGKNTTFAGGVGMVAISITAGSFGIRYKVSGGN